MIAPDIGLIGLDGAREPILRMRTQARTQLVQECLSRLVAAQARVALELPRRDPLLVARQEEDSQEPHPKRYTRPMENAARRHRGLMAAMAALLELPRLDEVASPFPTAGADEPSGPPHPPQVGPAARLVRGIASETLRAFSEIAP